MKKLLSVLLALAMLTAMLALVACGEEPDVGTGTTSGSTALTVKSDDLPGSSTATTSTTSTTSTTTATSGSVATATADTSTTASGNTGTEAADDGLDGLSKHPDYMDVNFGGKTFLFCTNETGDEWATYEIYAESTGDDNIITEAIINRNQVVESLYNCKISETKSESPSELISNDVSIGKSTYDFGMLRYSNQTVNGNWRNIASLDIDLNHYWWDAKYLDAFCYKIDGKDKLYTISGSFNLLAYDATWALFFNKKVYDELCSTGDITVDLYEAVRAGDWTMDVMLEMMEAASHDNNGDQKLAYADGDRMGLTNISNACMAKALLTGGGITTTVRDEATGLPVSIDSSNSDVGYFSEVIDKAAAIYNSSFTAGLTQTDTQASLVNGQSLFVSECMQLAKRITDEDAYFSIIPFPKYNTAQENYSHYVVWMAYGIKVPSTVSDLSAAGKFLEVFGFHSAKLLYPEYIKYYATQCFCDEEASEMLQIVLDSRCYDLGYYMSSGMSGKMDSFVTSGKNQFSRAVAASASTANTVLSQYIENMKKAAY